MLGESEKAAQDQSVDPITEVKKDITALKNQIKRQKIDNFEADFSKNTEFDQNNHLLDKSRHIDLTGLEVRLTSLDRPAQVRRIETDQTRLHFALPFCGLPPNRQLLGRESCFKKIQSFLDLNPTDPDYSRTFVISSPSGSGKTSILQFLLENYLFVDKKTTLYYFVAFNQSTNPWKTLEPFCDQNFNLSERFSGYQRVILLIDGAHNSYGFAEFWEGFRNTNLPESLRLIVSTSFYQTIGNTNLSSVAEIYRLERKDLLLSLEDSKSLIANILSDKQWINCQSLIDIMALDCGGLAGALQVSANQMYQWGSSKASFKVDQAVDIYLSIFDQLARCYGNLDSFLDEIRTTLLQSELHGLSSVSDISTVMFKTGLIESPDVIKFTSSLAKRYIFKKLFPSRALSNPSRLFDLIKLSITSMSSSLLKASTISNGLPKEAVFQQLFIAALAANTKFGTYIFHELSQIFPPVDRDNDELARNQGEIDFFVGGELRWGIELLIHGRIITEHTSRFKEGGKYALLKCNDHVVVDFRTGMPTKVKLLSNHISVLFPSQDYKTCFIVYSGEHGVQEEQLILQN